jgi:hypothetical protein
MNIKLRPVTLNDRMDCGSICFNAFKAIAEQHHFASEFPDWDNTLAGISSLIAKEYL